MTCVNTLDASRYCNGMVPGRGYMHEAHAVPSCAGIFIWGHLLMGNGLIYSQDTQRIGVRRLNVHNTFKRAYDTPPRGRGVYDVTASNIWTISILQVKGTTQCCMKGLPIVYELATLPPIHDRLNISSYSNLVGYK